MNFTKDDEPALQYSAAGLLTNWSQLPKPIQDVIIDSAVMGENLGLEPTTQLQQQINVLIKEKSK